MEGIYSRKEKESPYTNNVERMNPVSIVEYVEKADGEQMNPESVRSTCTRSRSKIQSNISGLKVMVFTNSETGQVGELVGDKEFMAYLANTPVVLNDNDLPFKNNIKYAWANFI